MSLFDNAVQALSQRAEEPDWNPYINNAEQAAIFSPAPQQYGVNMDDALDRMSAESKTEAAQAWLAASSWAFRDGKQYQDSNGIRTKVAEADSFVHLQDLKETDLLSNRDYAAHEAGFLAANTLLGGNAAGYHLDNTNPEKPVTRSISEEIARVVHARAANPRWIASMQPHGFRGAAEIAATLSIWPHLRIYLAQSARIYLISFLKTRLEMTKSQHLLKPKITMPILLCSTLFNIYLKQGCGNQGEMRILQNSHILQKKRA